MVGNVEVIKGECWEDSGVTLLARIRGDGGLVTQASIDTITCKVFDKQSSTPRTAVETPTVVVADSIFNTLQTDERWGIDDTGFNFAFEVPASIITSPHTYRIEFKFTPTSGEAFHGVWEVKAHDLWSS